MATHVDTGKHTTHTPCQTRRRRNNGTMKEDAAQADKYLPVRDGAVRLAGDEFAVEPRLTGVLRLT